MNTRQKKKLFKKNLIKIKKLHPQEGDVICITPDFEVFTLDEVVKFFNMWCDCGIFGKANATIIPGKPKVLSKEQYQNILKINEQLKGRFHLKTENI